MSTPRKKYTKLRKARHTLAALKAKVLPSTATELEHQKHADELVAAQARYVILCTKALRTPKHVNVKCIACSSTIVTFDTDLTNITKHLPAQLIRAALIKKVTLCSTCTPKCIITGVALDMIEVHPESNLPVVYNWEINGPYQEEDIAYGDDPEGPPLSGCTNPGHKYRKTPFPGCKTCHLSLAVGRAYDNTVAHSGE